MAGAISYPRTTDREENKSQARELKKLISDVTRRFNGETVDLSNIIALINSIDWNNLSPELLKKVLALFNELRRKNREFVLAQRAKEDDERRSDEEKERIKALNLANYRLESCFQASYITSLGVNDIRPYHEKLNSSGFYDFKEITSSDSESYFITSDGIILRESYLDAAVPLCVEIKKFVSQERRQELEGMADNMTTMSDDTRALIEKGWKNNDVFHAQGRFDDLKDFQTCITTLDETGIILGTHKELMKDDHNVMRKSAYQAEHSPPVSCGYAEDKLAEQSRQSVLVRDGLGEYSHDDALCFFIYDGQTKGMEHRIATDGAKAFAAKLQEDGDEASVKEWLDAAVEWNVKIIESRLMRNDTEPATPERAEQLHQESLKAAYALRNVFAAHMDGLGADLNAKLSNRVLGKKYDPSKYTKSTTSTK